MNKKLLLISALYAVFYALISVFYFKVDPYSLNGFISSYIGSISTLLLVFFLHKFNSLK